jgi:hypothetical protein
MGVDFRAAPQTLDNLQAPILDWLRGGCACRAGKTIYRMGQKDAPGKRLRRLRIAKRLKFGIDLADIVAVKFAG